MITLWIINKIIDGKAVSAAIKERVANETKELMKKGIQPCLAVILVGNDPASSVYVNNKKKACEYCGIISIVHRLSNEVSEEELIEFIGALNRDENIHGILVQLPLPDHIDEHKVIQTIAPEKDVDGFNSVNVGKLALNRDTFVSCTPYGIIKLLEEYKINLKGANAVILGRSNIVGKPLTQCLLNKDATVTICHSKTKNIEQITKNADILISAIGKPKFVTADMIKENAVVIDVGINRTQEGLVGDVEFKQVSKKASYITPMPGGVGPMTIVSLMVNTLKAAECKKRK